jgi:hypothetical protein
MQSNNKKYYPEELIAFGFTIPTFIIQLYYYVFIGHGKLSDAITLLIAFIVFLIIIKYSRNTSNKVLLFLRSYMHIPYYGILFTSFQTFVHNLNPKDYDILLSKSDHFVFGFDITVWFEKINSGWLTELLTISYFSYYLLPTLSALVFYLMSLKQNSKDINLRYFIFSIVFAWYAALIIYIIIPAAGPDIAFPSNYSIPIKGLSDLTAWYYATVTTYLKESFVRNTFPSLHFGIILIVNYFAFRWNIKYWLLCTLPLGLGLSIATLYLRQHYLIDLAGSIPLAVLSIFLSYKLITKVSK